MSIHLPFESVFRSSSRTPPSPLHLVGRDNDDLQIISALTQDAVIQLSDIALDRQKMRLAILLSRYCWEQSEKDYSVRSLLRVENVTSVYLRGLDPNRQTDRFSLLRLEFEQETSTLTIHTCSNAGFLLRIDDLEVILEDITAPLRAPLRPHNKG